MSKRSSFQAPRFLDSFGAVQRALTEIQDSLDAATRSGYQMGVRTSAVALTTGGFFRISAPAAGVTATLPAAGASNAAELITLCLEAMLGALTVHAPPGQTINGAVTATFSGEGIVTLFSNGADAWFSTSELPSESPGGAALDATYFLQTAHASLPNGRVGAATSYFGLTIGPDYDAAGFVSWEPGAQADGSIWAQLFSEGLNDVPRAWDLAGSLGEGLALIADVQNTNAQPIITVTEASGTSPIGTSHTIAIPSSRLPGDRIVVGFYWSSNNFGNSLLQPAELPGWHHLDGESTTDDVYGSNLITHDLVEIIIAADGSNDPGDSITLNTLGAISAAMGYHVWVLRDTHPSLVGNARHGGDNVSNAVRDVSLLLAPWRTANSFWGVFYGSNNASAPVVTFPTGFTTGQGQVNEDGLTVAFGSQLLRVDRIDATAWSATPFAPRAAAFTFVIPPRETLQIRLSAGSSIPAATFLANLFDYATEARAWPLSDFAGIGLSTSTSTGNGPFPEIDLDDSIAFSFDVLSGLTVPHLCPVPPLEQGQGLLMAVSSSGTASVTATPTERPWQSLGNGLGTSHRLTLFWLAPADVTTAVAALSDPVAIALSNNHGILVQFVAVDDHHPTQLPTLSAFSLQNGAGATTNDIGSVTPVPGDGSTAGNYTYAAILSTATEDSTVANPAGYPANYTPVGQTLITSTNGNIDNGLAWCWRQVRGASEDVGAFTYTGSGNGRSVGVNVAFIPASVAVMNWDGLGVQQASVAQGLFPTLDFASTASVLATGGAFADRWQVRYQRAALTGDVTAAQDVNVTVIANDAVSNAKLANMAAGTQKGRQIDAGTGDPVDLTGSEQGENIRHATAQNFSSSGVLALNDDTTNAIASGGSPLNLDGFSGANLTGRRIWLRAVPGVVMTLRHLTGAGPQIRCPHSVNCIVRDGESVLMQEHLGEWHVVTRVPRADGTVTMTGSASIDNFAVGGASKILVDITGNQSLLGIAGGYDGRVLYLCNTDLGDTVLTIQHVSSGTASDHIVTPRAVPYQLRRNEACFLVYYDSIAPGVNAWMVLDRLPPGLLLRVTVLSGSGTYTTPADVGSFIVLLAAGGGGGGGAVATVATVAVGAGGGGGGRELFHVTTPAASYAYAVGAGGAGGSNVGGDGADGADTTFGAATADHGDGGPGSANVTLGSGAIAVFGATGPGGFGGLSSGTVPSGGTLINIINGNGGRAGFVRSGTQGWGGGGGSSGDEHASGDNNSSAGNAPASSGASGLGGPGGKSISATGREGGAGGSGLIMIWEYS